MPPPSVDHQLGKWGTAGDRTFLLLTEVFAVGRAARRADGVQGINESLGVALYQSDTKLQLVVGVSGTTENEAGRKVLP